MKILVTGGAGFIGSTLIRLAISRGHSVVNVDMLTYAACLENLASVANSPNYAFEQFDSPPPQVTRTQKQREGRGCSVRYWAWALSLSLEIYTSHRPGVLLLLCCFCFYAS